MSRFAPIRLDTFILRLWLENTSHTWRGEIIHLPGNEAQHFATLAQAEGFIERFVPMVKEDPAGSHHREK